MNAVTCRHQFCYVIKSAALRAFVKFHYLIQWAVLRSFRQLYCITTLDLLRSVCFAISNIFAFMTKTSPTTNAQRQATFREQKRVSAALNASEVLRLTAENERLKSELLRVVAATARARVQHVSKIAKLRGQLLKSLDAQASVS